VDEIPSGGGNGVIKVVILDDNKLQNPAVAAAMVADGLPEGCSRSYEWMHLQQPTGPSEHPRGPDFDQDFDKMNQEFRNRIRSRQQEEWD
jgi:hypothetical protein